MSLTKPELIAAIADKTGNTKADTARFLEALSEVAKEELAVKKNKLVIPALVGLTPQYVEARTGRNPQTGATIQIAAANTVKVSAGSKLKAAVK